MPGASSRRLLALALLGAGCRGQTPREEPPRRGAETARASALDSAQLNAAQATFQAFLETSRVGSASRPALDTLTGCGEDAAGAFPAPLLADFEILPLETRGDTVVARAVAFTVAEQTGDPRMPGRLIVRQRVRADTLEWDVVPNAERAGWRVCHGLHFGSIVPDSLTEWRPEGASFATLRALADSVRRARQTAAP